VSSCRLRQGSALSEAREGRQAKQSKIGSTPPTPSRGWECESQNWKRLLAAKASGAGFFQTNPDRGSQGGASGEIRIPAIGDKGSSAASKLALNRGVGTDKVGRQWPGLAKLSQRVTIGICRQTTPEQGRTVVGRARLQEGLRWRTMVFVANRMLDLRCLRREGRVVKPISVYCA